MPIDENVKRIKLSSNFPYMPIIRQTPNKSGVWGRYRFVLDSDIDANEGVFDAWIVYNNMPNKKMQMVTCAPERTILIIGEPPSRTELHPDFASQFGKVVTCLPSFSGPKILHMQQALPWWVGLRRTGPKLFDAVMGYDEFAALTSIPKTRNISVICSNLAITPDHRMRLRFLRRLTRHFGDRIDAFGDGHRPVADKWDAIAPYKYHIAMENSRLNDYWTEKLADSFLGAAMPIYWGCENINQYFSADSLVTIDISRPSDAISIIEQVLAEDPYEKSQTALWHARRQLLDEYNLFPMLVRLVDELPKVKAKQCILRPTGDFHPTMKMKIQHWGKITRECVGRSLSKVNK
jgi:hypothetical protein